MELREKKISGETIYEGKIITIERDKVLCPNGHISSREVVRHCKASTILPILDNGNILLERQYRYPYDEILLELPAGKCDANEDPEITAVRELEEETGYHASHIEYLGKMYPTCGYSDEVIHLYVATNLIKTQTKWDENERVELLEVTPQEFEKWIVEGKIVDAKSIIAYTDYLLRIKK